MTRCTATCRTPGFRDANHDGTMRCTRPSEPGAAVCWVHLQRGFDPQLPKMKPRGRMMSVRILGDVK